MNGQQTKEALYALASKKEQEYIDRLVALDRANKTERKALKMLLNYTRNCAGFTKMDYMGNGFIVREEQIRNIHLFDNYLPYLESLNGDSRESFLVYAAAVSIVYANFYAAAKAVVEKGTANVNEAFEAKLKFDCTREILEKWITWWNENGFVKCEVVL